MSADMLDRPSSIIADDQLELNTRNNKHQQLFHLNKTVAVILAIIFLYFSGIAGFTAYTMSCGVPPMISSDFIERSNTYIDEMPLPYLVEMPFTSLTINRYHCPELSYSERQMHKGDVDKDLAKSEEKSRFRAEAVDYPVGSPKYIPRGYVEKEPRLREGDKGNEVEQWYGKSISDDNYSIIVVRHGPAGDSGDYCKEPAVCRVAGKLSEGDTVFKIDKNYANGYTIRRSNYYVNIELDHNVNLSINEAIKMYNSFRPIH